MTWIVVVLCVLFFVLAPIATGKYLAQTHDRYPIARCLGDVENLRTWRDSEPESTCVTIRMLDGEHIWIG